jgi:MFS transporter, CP family, cyanate transporter
VTATEVVRRTHRPLPAGTLIALFALIGLNLRSVFGAVPPLLDDIGADLALSGLALSLLTAIPTLCLGLLAPPAQRLALRVGHEQLTAAALVVLTLAEVLRLAGHVVVLLYLSTFLTGAAIGAISTMMPGLLGHHLHSRPGVGAGVYSTAMATASACAAWLAVPLAVSLGGWNRSLASWAILTAITTACWLLVLPRLTRSPGPAVDEVEDSIAVRLPWRSRTAWLLTAYFALQTFIGFGVMTWLAPAYREAGWDADAASQLLSVFFAVQVVAMLVLPAITDRIVDRRPLLLFSSGSAALGLLGFAATPSLAWVSVVLFGLGIGGGFAVGLVLLVDVTRSRAEAARLSAMVFLLCYTFAALGPVLVGALRDVSGGYALGFWLLVAGGVGLVAVVPFLRPGLDLLDRDPLSES